MMDSLSHAYQLIKIAEARSIRKGTTSLSQAASQRPMLLHTTNGLGHGLAEDLAYRGPSPRPSKGLGPSLRKISKRGPQYKLYACRWKPARQVGRYNKICGRGRGERSSDPRRPQRNGGGARCSIATGRRPHRNRYRNRWVQIQKTVALVKPGFEPTVNGGPG